MRWLLFRIGVTFCCLMLGQIIAATWAPPSTNTITFSLDRVGVPGGIPYRTTIYTNIVPAFSSAGIQAAINNCPSNQVVFFSNGVYTLTETLDIGLGKHGVTCRGESTNVVFKDGTGVGSFIIGIGGNTGLNAGTLLLTNAVKDATNCVVTSSSGLAVNELMYIDQDDDTDWVWSKSALARGICQLAIVRSITDSTNVTFWPPLVWYYKTSKNARVKHYGGSQTVLSGWENIALDYTGASSTSTGAFMDQSYGCWYSNIVSRLAPNYHMDCIDSLCCTWQYLELREQETYGPNHAGLRLYERISYPLVLDSIFYKAAPPIEINSMVVGAVLAYNFGLDSFQNSGGVAQYNMLWLSHGWHPMMVLCEGNYGNGAIADGYFGSASHLGIFRNRLHGWGPTMVTTNSYAIGFKHYTGPGNFSALGTAGYVVGNVLGRTGGDFYMVTNQSWSVNDSKTTEFELGFPNAGNQQYTGARPPNSPINPGDDQALDWFVKSNLVIHANFSFKSNTVIYLAGEETNLAVSFVPEWAAVKPGFIGNLPWPLIGPDVYTADNATNLFRSAGEITNPARERYFGNTYPYDAGVSTINTGTISGGAKGVVIAGNVTIK